MKFMYMMVLEFAFIELVSFTHHFDVDELVHPLSHHEYNGTLPEADAGAFVVNSTFCRLAPSPLDE
jgi:hypothetical protein